MKKLLFLLIFIPVFSYAGSRITVSGGGSGGGSGDNLGNHVATTNLDMSDNNIDNIKNLLGNNTTLNLTLPRGGGTGNFQFDSNFPNNMIFGPTSDALTLRSLSSGDGSPEIQSGSVDINNGSDEGWTFTADGGNVVTYQFRNSNSGGKKTCIALGVTTNAPEMDLCWDDPGDELVISTHTTVVGKLTSSTTFEIPNGASPTADDPGEIAHDTTENQLVMDDHVVGLSTHTFALSVSSPSTGSWDSNTIPAGHPFNYDVTITSVSACLLGTNTPSLAFNVEERALSSLNSAGTDMFSSDQTADADCISITSFSNSGWAANAHFVVTTDAAASSGDIEFLSLQFTYLIDRK